MHMPLQLQVLIYFTLFCYPILFLGQFINLKNTKNAGLIMIGLTYLKAMIQMASNQTVLN